RRAAAIDLDDEVEVTELRGRIVHLLPRHATRRALDEILELVHRGGFQRSVALRFLGRALPLASEHVTDERGVVAERLIGESTGAVRDAARQSSEKHEAEAVRSHRFTLHYCSAVGAACSRPFWRHAG